MKPQSLSARERFERILVALSFTVVGALTMIVFSPWRPLLERVPDYLGRIGLCLLLLVVILLARRSLRYQKYGQVFLGLLVLAVAVSLAMMVMVIEWDPLSNLFHTTPLRWQDWLVAAGLSLPLVPVVELTKCTLPVVGCWMPLTYSGCGNPATSRTVGATSMTWENCERISPLALMPFGQWTTVPLRVPPQWEATCLVHWHGVFIACAQPTA